MNDAAADLRTLFDRDALAATLGLGFVDAGPGHATVTLVVDARHINFNDSCHGGVIFALADTAFGIASNSHGEAAAAINAHVSFNAAVREGDTLTATARERSRGRRIATYGVDVTRDDGRLVAVFTGTVFVFESSPPGA